MPRVTMRERKAAHVKYPMVCRLCGQEVTRFERYYTWKKRFGGAQFTHVKCGYPRPSMLSNRKTAVIEDAIQDADFSPWAPNLGDHDTSDLLATLESVAEVADEVADEYESSADNMPESLQSGSQAEAMRDVADRLRDWAEEMRSWTPDSEQPDYLDEDEAIQAEMTTEAKQERHDAWVDETRESAASKLEDMPEYEG